MEEKLKKYIENQFTCKELKDNFEFIQEITANIVDRYNDEISSGISENEAYTKCIDSLGNIRSSFNLEKSIYKEKTYPVSLYISVALTVVAFVVFLFNAFWGLVVLCLTIVIFNLELRNQIYNVKSSKLSFMEMLLKAHKYFIVAWSFILSIIILETIFNFSLITEDYIKFTFDMYYNSEPVGMIFIINLILMAIIFIPLSIYHNKLVDSYKRYKDIGKNLRFRFWRSSQAVSFSKYKNREFLIYLLLMVIGLVFIFLSKVQLYLLGYNPISEEILGLQLAGSYTFLEFTLSQSSTSWPSIILFSTIGLFILYIILSIFMMSIRQAKYITKWNILFTVTLFLVFIIQSLFTGVNYTFSMTLSNGLGLLVITFVFKSMFKNIEVLNYE